MLTNIAHPSKLSLAKLSWLKDLFLIGMGSILIALCAPIAIKLPFTPVPLAIASHVCLFLGIVLGPRRGALAVIFYLLQGAAGLPVFALGDAGLLHLLGPRGGYLLGYVAAAYLAGTLNEKKGERSSTNLFLAITLGNLVIYILGVGQLSCFLGFKSALLLGMLPFLIGDLLKSVVLYRTIKLSFLRNR